MYIDSFPSPLGWFTVVVDGGGAVVASHLGGDDEPAGPGRLNLPKGAAPPRPDPDRTRAARKQLLEYARGERTHFELPLAPVGTAFQREAWKALLAIPFGETRSYRQQALALGHPKAVRAVGGANGRNRLMVLIPCHRVIGSDGGLTGFGGGLGVKQRLLDHERRVMERAGRDPMPRLQPELSSGVGLSSAHSTALA